MDHHFLFHPRTIKKAMDGNFWPADLADRHRKLNALLRLEQSGELVRTLETELQGDYIKTLFEGILGYKTRLGGDGTKWTISPERNVAATGVKRADGGIGWFEEGKAPVIHAVLELKGASQDLDTTKGRSQTPVQQAWDYAVQSNSCRWILVSNYRELRLYHRSRSQAEYEVFRLRDLVELDSFKRLLFLLSAESLLPARPGEEAPLDRLLAASERTQVEITEQLYKDYRSIRADLFEELRRSHSNLPPLELLGHAQKLLDRVLFVAFAEDRGLLPPRILADALKEDVWSDGLWSRLKRLFTWIDRGEARKNVHAYNGGLFAEDAELDALELSDRILARLRDIEKNDFAEDVSVEVLGHIFEQSISDLEDLRAQAAGQPREGLSKRDKHGVFYTPAFVTRYIVEQTLGAAFRQSLDAAIAQHQPEAQRGKKQQEAAWEKVWLQHRSTLAQLRVLDPACGSGAFLVAAYDALAREYERTNNELAALREGQRDVFDLNRSILQGNLYGVDLNPESVEITRLSLWLKTAEAGKKLTALDLSIVCGDSICADPTVAERAFDWGRGRRVSDPGGARSPAERAIVAAWSQGFDVVVGNPPYVRQEWLAPKLKDHLRSHYKSFHGMADLFVYFFERGLTQLKPGGRLGFIVANKWLKGGYAEPLRKLLATETRIEQLIDFGHAPIFPDADAFPSIIVMQKRPPAPMETFQAVVFPREELAKNRGVEEFVVERRLPIPLTELGAAPWSLEPPAVRELMAKLRAVGRPLGEVAGKPFRGFVTGYNDAFVVDEATRGALLREDARSAELIYPFLRGRDVDRWVAHRSDQYMIFTRRGVNIESYPAIQRHLQRFRTQLEPKPASYTGDDWPGRKPGNYLWFEIQDSADYWQELLKPKIVYQVIQFNCSYALASNSSLMNDKVFAIPGRNLWLMAVLNSPLMWWNNWRYLVHLKDEALTPLGIKMLDLPIPEAPPGTHAQAEEQVEEAIQITTKNQESSRDLLEWLRHEHGIDTPGRALEDFAALSTDSFVNEVKKRRPKTKGSIKPGELRELRQLHEGERLPMLQRTQRLLLLEKALSTLVNRAFQLTEDDILLLQKTAPPRSPPGL